MLLAVRGQQAGGAPRAAATAAERGGRAAETAARPATADTEPARPAQTETQEPPASPVLRRREVTKRRDLSDSKEGGTYY